MKPSKPQERTSRDLKLYMNNRREIIIDHQRNYPQDPQIAQIQDDDEFEKIKNLRGIRLLSNSEIRDVLRRHDRGTARDLHKYIPICVKTLPKNLQTDGIKIYLAIYIVSGEFNKKLDKKLIRSRLFKYFTIDSFNEVWQYVIEIENDKEAFIKKYYGQYEFVSDLHKKPIDNSYKAENFRIILLCFIVVANIGLAIFFGHKYDGYAAFGSLFLSSILSFILVAGTGIMEHTEIPPKTYNEYKRRRINAIKSEIHYNNDNGCGW